MSEQKSCGFSPEEMEKCILPHSVLFTKIGNIAFFGPSFLGFWGLSWSYVTFKMVHKRLVMSLKPLKEILSQKFGQN